MAKATKKKTGRKRATGAAGAAAAPPGVGGAPSGQAWTGAPHQAQQPWPPPPDPTQATQAVQEAYARMQAVSDAYTRQYKEAALRYQEAAAKGDPQALAEKYQTLAAEYGAELYREGLQLAVGYMEAAQKLSERHMEALLGQLDGSMQAGAGAPAEPPAQPLTLELEGEAGSTVAGTFSVENESPAAVTPNVMATPLTRDGEPLEGTAVVVEPASFDLAPNQAQDVTVRVPLDSDAVASGDTLRAAIAIVGLGGADRVVSLELRVL